MLKRLLFFILIFLGASTPFCFAYNVRSLNLGGTSYFDGMNFPTGGGWYLLMTPEHYSSDTFTDSQGNPIAGLPGPGFRAISILPQLIYESRSKPFLNAHLGFDLLQPMLLHLHLDKPNLLGLTDNGTGTGDLIAGPFLQWDTIIKNGKPLMGNRIEFDTFFPTGKYDEDKVINPGFNYYSFEPYWANTTFLTPKLEVSFRWHYLWNSQNDTTGFRAGQITHINFAASYELTKPFQPGIAGYYLKQLTDSELYGVVIPNSREQVFAIGPGFAYIFSKTMYVTANYFFESNVENRPKGNRVSAMFVFNLG